MKISRLLHLFIFFVLLQQNPLHGQEQPTLNFSIHVGQVGMKKNTSRNSSFSERENSKIPGIYLSSSISYQMPLAKFFILESGLEYSFETLRNLEEITFLNFRGELREVFETHSIGIPMIGSFQFKKMGLSFGVKLRHHLNTRMHETNYYFSTDTGVLIQEVDKTYSHGDYNEIDYGGGLIDYERIKLERRINIQYLIGLNYQLYSKIKLHFNFQNYFYANHLNKEIFNYDAGSKFEKFFPFDSSFSLGLSWQIKGW